jgi:nucleolar MIF4G domain-containing protein 1
MQAIDFTALQSSTITFLTTCISHLIIATQTQSPLFALPKSFKRSAFDPEPVEELFERTLSNFELAQGWAWLMQTEMGKKGNDGAEEVGPVEGEIVKLGLGVARGVVAKAI